MTKKTALVGFILIVILFGLVFMVVLGTGGRHMPLSLRASERSKVIIAQMEKRIPEVRFWGSKTPLAVRPAASKTSESFGRSIIPTVLGSVSPFTGASQFSYSFNLPQGPGGFAPELGLQYSSQIIDDARAGNSFWQMSYSVPPATVGMGFSLSGLGSIVRDTRGRKDVLRLGEEPYHRFILTLPSGAYELRYRKDGSAGVWTTTPQGFLRIEHPAPYERTASKRDFNTVIDGKEWVVTTKDGTKYWFGEPNLEDRLNANGRISDATEIQKDGKRLTKDGHLSSEYELVYLCTGSQPANPCETREVGKPDILVTRWLLRRMESASGLEVTYSYQANQVALDERYFTPVTYPSEVLWNEDKYRVVYAREERPDTGSQDEVLERIAEARVEVKLPSDNRYHLARRYTLGYYSESELGDMSRVPEKDYHHSLLHTITEFGKEGEPVTKLPAVSFAYQPLSGLSGNTANASYLASIDNGYGRKTTFAYQSFNVGYRIKTNEGDNTASGRWGSQRARVAEKIVSDLVTRRSAREQYVYDQPVGFAETLGDSSREDDASNPCQGCFPPTGLQFLGHRSIDVRSSDFDGSTLAHQSTEFYQAAEGAGCFAPHPARGLARVVTQFNQGIEAKKSLTTYRYRLDGADGQDTEICNADLVNQPYFVYTKRIDTVVQEAGTTPDTRALTTQRTARENLEYDAYGNLQRSVELGEVDSTTGVDLDPSDNRYSYSYSLVNDGRWMLGLPVLSYLSTSGDCVVSNPLATSDCQKKRLEYLYDGRGLGEEPVRGLMTEKRIYNSQDRVYKETVEYDQWGNVVATNSPAPNQKTTSQLVKKDSRVYDDFYHAFIMVRTNGMGFQTRYSDYDYLLGFPQTVRMQISANPAAFSLEKLTYDGVGRLVQSVSSDPTAERYEELLAKPTHSYRYFDDHGLVVRTMRLSGKSGNEYSYLTDDAFYDGMGNVIQTQILESVIDGESKRLVQSADFNALGQPIREHERVVDAPLPVTSPPEYLPPSGRLLSETNYDELGRVETQIKHSEEGFQTIRHDYFANGDAVTDPKGATKVSIFDPWSRTIWKRLSSSDGKQLTAEEKYAMPLVDKPTQTQITASDSPDTRITTSITYDEAGYALTTSDPSLGELESEYDILGNTILQRRKKGDESIGEVTLTYDLLGRVTEKRYSTRLYAKPSGKSVIRLTYDEGANAVGQLVHADDPTGQTAFSYDRGGRINKVTKNIFGKVKETRVVTNEWSQPVNETYPSGDTVEYWYDREGRHQTVRLTNEPLVSGVLYNKLGQEVATALSLTSKNYESRAQYDASGRIRAIVFGERGQSPLFAQTLNYNQTGELRRTEDGTNPAKSREYTYDSFSRLKNSSGVRETSYSYDAFGRILMKKETDELHLQYDNTFPVFAPKRLESPGKPVEELHYDKTGGLASDPTRCYQYNQEGRLVVMADKRDPTGSCSEDNLAAKTSFYYDYNGDLVLIESNAKQTYIYGNYEEIDGGEGSNPQVRLMLPIGKYASVIKNTSQTFVLVKDNLSSSRLIVGADGQVVFAADYYPYGSLVEETIPPSLPTDRLFTAQRKLEGSPIYHFAARAYSPEMGIFLQPDTLESANRYAYAANNPMMVTDPTGNANSLGEIGDGALEPPTINMTARPAVATSQILATGVYLSTHPPQTNDLDADPQALTDYTMFLLSSGMAIPSYTLVAPAVVTACSLKPDFCVATLGNIFYEAAAPLGAPQMRSPLPEGDRKPDKALAKVMARRLNRAGELAKEKNYKRVVELLSDEKFADEVGISMENTLPYLPQFQQRKGEPSGFYDDDTRTIGVPFLHANLTALRDPDLGLSVAGIYLAEWHHATYMTGGEGGYHLELAAYNWMRGRGIPYSSSFERRYGRLTWWNAGRPRDFDPNPFKR